MGQILGSPIEMAGHPYNSGSAACDLNRLSLTCDWLTLDSANNFIENSVIT